MFINGTKKLLDYLKLKSTSLREESDESEFYSWHANVISINRKRAVVLMNDRTQYVIVLYGMQAKDLSRLPSIFEQAIRTIWRDEGIKEDVIDTYLNRAGEIQFAKTKNRSLVARLNQACKEVAFFELEINRDTLIQSELSFQISRLLAGRGKEGYIEPNKVLYECLQEMSGADEIFSVRAVELKVQLMLETKDIWRTLIVPLNRTFSQFHYILQRAFSWTNSHVHEFYIFDKQERGSSLSINHPAYTKESAKPIVNLVDHEEAFHYPGEIPMKLEQGIKLSEYLPEADLLMYIYDLGDNWRHRIDVLRVIEDYPSNHPVCTGGEGDAPPEDVGGESGYLHFLEIINDTKHPEHEHMKKWALGQLYTKFDLERVNVSLKNK